MSGINCNLSTLAPYTGDLNVSKINHLYRRIAFGATKADVVNALVENDAEALVDRLVDASIPTNLMPTTPLPWANETFDYFDNLPEGMGTGFLNNEGRKQMIKDQLDNRLRDRMTLFWSNHFVTEEREYRSPAYQNQYYYLLQLHALGNFRDFVHAVGISAPMLVYLNGDRNRRDRPNENYARELYELFTLGINNGYTENDIVETARAITGWVDTNDIRWGPITFDASEFDSGSKTIFGQTSAFDYDGVIDNLFTQRSDLVAQFICGKLYTYFVSPSCNDAIVNEMAQTFIANNFDIAPVLRQLFKSQHFFDQEAIGVIIKSPIDLLNGFFNELQLDLSDPIDTTHDFIQGTSATLQQRMLNPIDVAGWPGNEFWISPDLLIGRWESIRYFITRARAHNPEQFRDFIVGLPIGEPGDGVLQTSTRDVELVVQTITNYFFSRGITDPVIFNEAVGVFRGNVPDEYFEPTAVAPLLWDLTSTELANQCIGLLDYIAEIPEFQLK